MKIDNLKAKAGDAAVLLKALSNEKRLMIVCVLIKGEMCVGDLEKLVGLSQSALSQHLARLRRDGIVTTRRAAQTIFYSIGNQHIGCILECLSNIFFEEGGACESNAD